MILKKKGNNSAMSSSMQSTADLPRLFVTSWQSGAASEEKVCIYVALLRNVYLTERTRQDMLLYTVIMSGQGFALAVSCNACFGMMYVAETLTSAEATGRQTDVQ